MGAAAASVRGGALEGERVECLMCEKCGALSIAVPVRGERRCGRCGGRSFRLVETEVDAGIFERTGGEFSECCGCANMWDGLPSVPAVLCPFIRERATVSPWRMFDYAERQCPFRRPASEVDTEELAELAALGNRTAASELCHWGKALRCARCGEEPTVERSDVIEDDCRLHPYVDITVRCRCGEMVRHRFAFADYAMRDMAGKALFQERALEKWNERALAVPSLARIMRMLKEHTVE